MNQSAGGSLCDVFLQSAIYRYARVLLWPAVTLCTVLAVGASAYGCWTGRQTLVQTTEGDMRRLFVGTHVLNINQRSKLTVKQSDRGYVVNVDQGEASFLTSGQGLTVSTPDAVIPKGAGFFGVRVLPGKGTDVSVSIDGTDTPVQCGSGSSDPESLSGSVGKRLVLHADQSVLVTPDCEFRLGNSENRSVPVLSPHEELRFNHVPLAIVLKDFNHYHQHPIRIQDPAIAGELISGAFNPLDRQELLRHLAVAHGIRFHKARDGSDLLTGRTHLAAIP